MKFLLASLFIASASAFAPQPLPNSRISTTDVHNVLDPEMLNHLAQHGEDAATAMFVNCDSEGCELFEGVHESDGWLFDSKGPVETDHSQMLMMSMEDTE